MPASRSAPGELFNFIDKPRLEANSVKPPARTFPVDKALSLRNRLPILEKRVRNIPVPQLTVFKAISMLKIMKRLLYLPWLGAFGLSALAQVAPGAPEINGLNPNGATTYVNSQASDPGISNNGNTESLGVAIASSGNIILGWEDDGNGIADREAIWTMYDSGGSLLIQPTLLTSLSLPGSETNIFLSYFRPDGSAVWDGTSWGPKIKANLFGPGTGMAANSYGLGEEVSAFLPWDDANSGDFPSAQLLGDAGQPLSIVAGISSAYATGDPGSVRAADFEFLANGNVLLVSESRQDGELITRYQGDSPAHHAIFRIVDSTGQVVKPETLVSDTPIKSEIWHGAGVVSNGFAIRFSGPNGATVRLFNNAGNPLSTNIDLATLTGFAAAGAGGRGDGAGFHGNSVDAFVAAAGAFDTNGSPVVWVTVFDKTGKVRFSKPAADDLSLLSVGRADAAIDPSGNVIVVFDGKFDPNVTTSSVMGRRFDSTGKPLGGTFYISELELPGQQAADSTSPRVFWRNNQVAVVWQSKNDSGTIDPDTGNPRTVVGLRLFSTFNPGSPEAAGLKRIVADTPVIKPDADSLGNWEPYVGVVGNSVFLIEGNTFAADGSDTFQRYVVAFQPVDGSPAKLGNGFFDDSGHPYTGQINLSRQNGNPGRVAGDQRPGAINFIVGAETSVDAIPGFNSNGRWNHGIDYLGDGRFGTVQTFSLDPSSLTQTALGLAQDSAYGRANGGTPSGNQISRFGGEITALDNGNFVSVVQDNAHILNPNGNAVVATIFAPNGTIVKEAFLVAPTSDFTVQDVDIWSNVAAYQGGFAVRTKSHDGSSRAIYFFNNQGVATGFVDQSASGVSFDTGRGDGTRIFGHINSPYVYLTGRAVNTKIIKVAAFDSRNASFVGIGDVNEGAFTGDFDRAFGAVDALNRLTIGWVSQPAGYANQQVAARVLAFDGSKKSFKPLTPSFFPFVNTATNGIRTLQMSVAMTTKQILIAAKGEISYENTPQVGPDSPKEVNFYTVLSHPAPVADPTTPVPNSSPTLHVVQSGGNIVISWDASAQGYVLESKSHLTDAAWTTVGTQNPATVPLNSAARFYRLRK